jgi:hypothetical protein
VLNVPLSLYSHCIEPISPTTSNAAPSSTSTASSSAKPSITGVLKQVVKAPSEDEIVEPTAMEDAIQSVGDDGGAKNA